MNAHTLDLFDAAEAPRLFDDVDHPDHTPWGASQGWDKLAPGIWSCHTASHGGIWLSPQRMAAMPAERRKTWAGGPWFEEDEDWHLVALTFPEAFKPEHVEAAHRTVEAIDRRREELERQHAKETGRGWARAAVCVDPSQFKPEHREAAQAAADRFKERLVFVLDDNDRRAIVADYQPCRPATDNTPTGLDVTWLSRLPF